MKGLVLRTLPAASSRPPSPPRFSEAPQDGSSPLLFRAAGRPSLRPPLRLRWARAALGRNAPILGRALWAVSGLGGESRRRPKTFFRELAWCPPWSATSMPPRHPPRPKSGLARLWQLLAPRGQVTRLPLTRQGLCPSPALLGDCGTRRVEAGTPIYPGRGGPFGFCAHTSASLHSCLTQPVRFTQIYSPAKMPGAGLAAGLCAGERNLGRRACLRKGFPPGLLWLKVKIRPCLS